MAAVLQHRRFFERPIQSIPVSIPIINVNIAFTIRYAKENRGASGTITLTQPLRFQHSSPKGRAGNTSRACVQTHSSGRSLSI